MLNIFPTILENFTFCFVEVVSRLSIQKLEIVALFLFLSSTRHLCLLFAGCLDKTTLADGQTGIPVHEAPRILSLAIQKKELN